MIMLYGTLVVYALVLGALTAGAVLAIIHGIDWLDAIRKQ